MGGRLLHPPMTAVIIVCLSDRPALTSQEGNEPASQTAGLRKQIQTALCRDALPQPAHLHPTVEKNLVQNF